MAIAFRSSSKGQTALASTSLVVTAPTGVAEDDALLAFARLDAFEAVTATGWTQVVQDSQLTVLRRVAPASPEVSHTFTWTSSVDAEIHLLAYTGVDTTTPVDVSAITGFVGGSGTSVVAPSATTTAADTMLVCVWTGGNQRDVTAAASMTQRSTTAGGNVPCAGTGDEAIAATGATGTRTGTLSANSGGREAASVALAPATGAGAQTVSPTGIATTEAFGSPTVTQPGPGQTVSSTGVASAEAFGSPTITQTAPESVAAAWQLIELFIEHGMPNHLPVPKPRPGAIEG